uniref:Uncharacterized protein n=1 Tax=Salix viminalis TaxID=40686 RepID=A0A6N2KFH1_SALVM
MANNSVSGSVPYPHASSDLKGNGQGFQFLAIMLLWFNQWSSHQLIPVIHGIAEHAILIIRLDMRGKFFLLTPFVYYMQMLKVLTILFRCHHSGFCQNQGESKPGVGTGESSPLPAYGNHSDNTEEMHDQKKRMFGEEPWFVMKTW